MKIAVTARNFTTPGQDTPLKMLLEAGHEVIDLSDRDMGAGTPIDEITEVCRDADIIIAGLEPMSRQVLESCPNVKMISRRGIGYDSVDVAACREKGIAVARTVGAVEGSVAEHVMAYILYFARRIDMQSASMHRGEWKRVMTGGVKTRRLGLVGFGGIGKEIAKRALPFGMDIVYNCRHPEAEWEKQYGAKYLPLYELLKTSDYVSVNVPLTDETRGMFGKEQFGMMKEGSVFINIARSPITDVYALKDALVSKHLGGAAIDVFDSEPCTDSPLIGVENAVLTPHTAPYTDENFITLNLMAAKNVLDFIDGRLDPKVTL